MSSLVLIIQLLNSWSNIFKSNKECLKVIARSHLCHLYRSWTKSFSWGASLRSLTFGLGWVRPSQLSQIAAAVVVTPRPLTVHCCLMLCCKVCYCTRFWHVTRRPVLCMTTVKLLGSSELWRLFTFRQDCVQSPSEVMTFKVTAEPKRLSVTYSSSKDTALCWSYFSFLPLARQTTFACLIPDHTGFLTPSSGIVSVFRIAQYILWPFVHQMSIAS